MPYINAEIYCDPSEFSDDELLDELHNRWLIAKGTPLGEEIHGLINNIYERATSGRDYQQELSRLFDLSIGRIYVPA